ncbi:permease-like cell division protein FtsX [Kamptonema cortianum]|nr:permease-like cell division protein FtsX [Geitlerinema splendidum]MDK3162216.1 permease-like cell division protein FtsX [Kamptonema cortianum]
MLDKVEFVLSEAFVSLKRNTWMTFATVSTCAMALFIIGGLSFVYFGLAKWAGELEDKFQISVFAADGATPDEIKTLGDQIAKINGVKNVDFRSKKQVWEEFSAKNPGIVTGLEIDNPLPDTYIVSFDSLSKADSIVSAIRKLKNIAPKDGVQYLSEEQKLLEQTMSVIRWLGLVLGGVMLATGGILIYNTIRLTMISRRREIRIMELVGATRRMVWTPLLIEGLVQGVIGALIAFGVLWIAYAVVMKLISFAITQAPGQAFPAVSTLIFLCLAGAAYGLGCSYWAIRDNKGQEITR